MFWKLILKRGKEKDGYNREKVSKETSTLGLISNLIAAAVKVLLYIFTGSISILSDAVNNITDCASSIISIIGIKLASKPRDSSHPYGHGRFEYLISLVVSGIILAVGFQFLRASINRIISPVPINYPSYTVAILIFTVILKLWQANLYKNVSDAIESGTLKALEKDSLSDSIITGVVLISIAIEKLFNLTLDGYVGVVVALFILYTALDLINESISIILGRGLPRDIKNEIKSKVASYEGITNVHNIMVTDFGPENIIVIIDAALAYDMTLEEVHNIVDKVEREVSELLDIKLIIHPDPLGSSANIINDVEKELSKIIRESLNIYSCHDIVLDDNKFYIDVDYNAESLTTREETQKLKTSLEEKLEKIYPNYKFCIILDPIF